MITLNAYNGIIIFGLTLCIIVLLFIIFKYIFAEKALNISKDKEKQNDNNIQKTNIIGLNIENSNKKFATVVKSSKFVTSNNQNINVVALGNDEVLIFSDNFFTDMSEEERILHDSILSSEDEANVEALEKYFYEAPQDYTQEEWLNLFESGLAEEFGLSNSDLVNKIAPSDLEEVSAETDNVENKQDKQEDINTQVQNSFYTEDTDRFDDDTAFDVNDTNSTDFDTSTSAEQKSDNEEQKSVIDSDSFDVPDETSTDSTDEQEQGERQTLKEVKGKEGEQGELFF